MPDDVRRALGALAEQSLATRQLLTDLDLAQLHALRREVASELEDARAELRLLDRALEQIGER